METGTGEHRQRPPGNRRCGVAAPAEQRSENEQFKRYKTLHRMKGRLLYGAKDERL